MTYAVFYKTGFLWKNATVAVKLKFFFFSEKLNEPCTGLLVNRHLVLQRKYLVY